MVRISRIELLTELVAELTENRHSVRIVQPNCAEFSNNITLQPQLQLIRWPPSVARRMVSVMPAAGAVTVAGEMAKQVDGHVGLCLPV